LVLLILLVLLSPSITQYRRAFLFGARLLLVLLVLPIPIRTQVLNAGSIEANSGELKRRMAMTLTEEIIQAALVAPDARKTEALRVLRGENHPVDAETLRRCAGQTEQFLTLKECARRLGLHESTLWKWQVPKHTLGGRAKFRMSEIEAYLASEAFKQRAEELRVQDRERRALRS